MPNDANRQLRAEFAAGFARPQKILPSKYFYDDHGSRLFEEITRLPEYYLTRVERELLEEVIPELIQRFRPGTLSELGAGAAVKTRIILDAMADAECARLYQPIDISSDFLLESAAILRGEYIDLRIEPLVADFTKSLPLTRTRPSPCLFAFLGSTLGNLDNGEATRLLNGVRMALAPADRLLIGVDLRKAPAQLEDAYNDAAGITAEFNLNLLRVMNRNLGTDFDLDSFEHLSFYDRGRGRIEMHLVSRGRQRIEAPGLGIYDLASGESIRTELSCKYDRAQITALLGAARLRLDSWWSDDDGLFALALAAPA